MSTGNTHRCIFLDRDGVINEEVGYITEWPQLKPIPSAVTALGLLHDAGWKTIVITNQSAVARGMMTEARLREIHARLLDNLCLDAIYYCPHYYNEGDVEIPPYRIACDCRKPGAGLIIKAAKEHAIDLSSSYMVGDRTSDILAGKNAGLKTVLLNSGYGVKDLEFGIQPDYIFNDLLGFVKFLIQNSHFPAS